LVAETGARESIDAAGNQWFTLAGESERAVLIGGHIDSVPNGGWLDGALNVIAGVEVLRRVAADGSPPVTLRLVNWADEEGARFGRSLFGSSAAAGSMSDRDELRQLTDRDGPLPAPCRARGRPRQGTRARKELDSRRPMSSSISSSRSSSPWSALGVVQGTFGVERHRVTWHGQAAHAGSTPMDKRRDALAGAAKLALEIRDIARRAGGGAVCTSGGVVCHPGIVTSVVETAEQLLDQRHLDAERLASMLAQAKEASERFAAEESRSTGRGSGRSSRSSSTTLCSASARRLFSKSRGRHTGSRPGRCTTPRKWHEPAFRP
jgi:N-carbamoyl-L-amino-acid hydrolase